MKTAVIFAVIAVFLAAGYTSPGWASNLISEFMCPCPDLCGKALETCECGDAAGYIKEIEDLRASGLSASVVRDKMVEKYGPSVLASPPPQGFGLLAYVIPPLAIVLGISLALILVRKWRRRRLAAADSPAVNTAEFKRAEELVNKWKSWK